MKQKINGKYYRQFAASGNYTAQAEYIIGKVTDQITFTSPLFSATIDSQAFWDKLAALAKQRNKYIVLVY